MNKAKSAARRAFCFFSFAVLAYTGFLAVGLGDSKGLADTYGLLFKNICVIFAYALAFGFSFLVFEIKRSPVARRILHVFLLYAATLGTLLALANISGGAREVIIFIFISTLLYAVVYTAVLIVFRAVSAVINKRK